MSKASELAARRLAIENREKLTLSGPDRPVGLDARLAQVVNPFVRGCTVLAPRFLRISPPRGPSCLHPSVYSLSTARLSSGNAWQPHSAAGAGCVS